MRPKQWFFAVSATLLFCQPVDSQNLPPPQPWTASYADLADLAIPAAVTAHVRVERGRALSERDAPNVPPGYRRFLVEAGIVALIRGPAELPQQVRYLVDLPNENGRAARIRRGTEYLVLAAPATNRPGEIRLVAPDAQLPYDVATAGRLRDILREATQANPAPRITGIGRAFHVPGSLPGESETQFFLQTADGRPISLTVLRRPGETPTWAVALSEIVDNAAEPPAADTLLWYRLACTLPPALPRQSLAEAGPDEARAIESDYRVIRQGLGACVRNRRPR